MVIDRKRGVNNMMDKNETNIEAFRKFLDGLKGFRANMEYQKNTSIKQFLKDLQKEGIEIYEKEVVEKYKELETYKKVSDYFYNKHKREIEILDRKRIDFNSDTLYFFISEFIKNNFDTKTNLDIYYITDQFYDVGEYPKEAIQGELMCTL